jgi:hypothetical protein
MTTSEHRRFTPIPSPAGAVRVHGWQPEGYRVFEGEQRCVGESIKVWTHGIQRIDARIDDGAIEAPDISVEGLIWEEGISSDTARRLADLLVMAADEIDRWASGTESGCQRLTYCSAPSSSP